MQLHDIQPKTKRKSTQRIGRGGARGKYSGRGIKGQKAHSSGRIRPPMRDIIKKIHKKRGYRFSSSRTQPEIINVSALQGAFESGSVVSPKTLLEKKLVKRKGNTISVVKILGVGELKKELTISGCLLSKSAQEKIEKAGGSIK
ncbi:50S ribosomal protein L15 [bacterium]|nr:50S ribosomal protein L15 [bacterium]|tara:strand:+ start:5153 stop:5584 length:432 start_codon:yes stop_codon:yes gene_type:complete